MKKTLIYLIALLVLLAIAWFAVFAPPKGTLSEDADFIFADTASITKIRILNKNKSTIVLEKKSPEYWRVNDRFKARPDATATLLNTFRKFKVMFPVPLSGKASIMKSFVNPFRTIELYTDISNAPVRTYYMGGVPPSGKGTYMLLDNADHPYVVSVPGFDGELITRSFTDPEVWRDRLIFNYPSEKIAVVEIDYIREPENSFRLDNKGPGAVSLNPLYPDKAQRGSIDQTYAKEYLNDFKKLHCEAYENGHPKIDSIQASTPFLKMKVINDAGKEQAIVVHYMMRNKRTKTLSEGTQSPYDLDRFYVFLPNGNMALIQDFVFGKLFKKHPDFLVKE